MSQTPDPVVPPTRLVNQALAVFNNFLDVIYCNLSSGLPPNSYTPDGSPEPCNSKKHFSEERIEERIW